MKYDGLSGYPSSVNYYPEYKKQKEKKVHFIISIRLSTTRSESTSFVRKLVLNWLRHFAELHSWKVKMISCEVEDETIHS